MQAYKVKMNTNGEVVLPLELRDELGLLPEDSLELKVDTQGALLVRTAERSAGPLADFFEDLILADLRCDGCSGDVLRARFLERKVQLSHSIDRLVQEGHRAQRHRQAPPWREVPELKQFMVAEEENGSYQVLVTSRAEREFRPLPEKIVKQAAIVLESLEWDPTVYKRLRGPYYGTYRVAFYDEGPEHYRILYAVFRPEQVVTILSIGERHKLYDHLKAFASAKN